MVELILENEQDKEELTPEIEKAIKDVCVAVMEEEECDFDAEISVTLVDNDTIRSINKEQRDIDRATDVLSFPMLEFDEDGISDDEYDMDGELVMLGDIVISCTIYFVIITLGFVMYNIMKCVFLKDAGDEEIEKLQIAMMYGLLEIVLLSLLFFILPFNIFIALRM